jgi:hypothetical protein
MQLSTYAFPYRYFSLAMLALYALLLYRLNSGEHAAAVQQTPEGAEDWLTICSGEALRYDLQANIDQLGNGVPASFRWVALANNPAVEGETLTEKQSALIDDVLRNTGAALEEIAYQVVPSANGTSGDPFLIRALVLPEVAVRSALAIRGVDYPSSGVCGHFNVIMDLSIRNTGKAPLKHIGALLDLSASDQFGSAFLGLAPGKAPAIVAGSAAANPALRNGYAGAGDIFRPQTGRLLPGQFITVRLTFEVNPQAPGAPSSPKAQAQVSGEGDFSVLQHQQLDTQKRCYAYDRSDDGVDPLGANPGFPGDTGGEDDPTPLTECWRQSKELAAIAQVNITADPGCTVTLNAEKLIQPHRPACDATELPLGSYYRVFYQGEEVKGPIDVRDDIGQQLVYEVKSVADHCRKVWGYVLVEDKTAPEVHCPADVRGIIKNPERRPSPFRAAAGPEERQEGETFQYLVCTDIDSIYQRDRSWKDRLYPYYTGFPTVRDGCSRSRLVSVEESLRRFDCEDNLDEEGRQLAARLTRTFLFVDEKGNQAYCEQLIYFYRPVLHLPDCKVELDVCLHGDDPGLDPAALRQAPYYVNGACDTIQAKAHFCDFTISYEDQRFPGPDQCGFKVVRVWSILDWCWRPLDYRHVVAPPAECLVATPWQAKKMSFEQHLVVGDFKAPKVSCPEGKTKTESGESILLFTAGPFDCRGVVAPPSPIVEGECREVKWEFELYGDVFNPKTLLSSYQLIGKSQNGMLAGVETGQYDLVYIVSDACGNTSRSANCRVAVRDQAAPIAICNKQLNVSLGGEGLARVSAQDANEGSWDNCGPVDLHVRRAVKEACLDSYVRATREGKKFGDLREALNLDAKRREYYDGDILVLTLEAEVYWSAWAPEIFFTCCDAGQDASDLARIELRATDRGGLSNKCWMEVLIENKIAPRCVVRDEKIFCTELDFDPENPNEVAARFGRAETLVQVFDNCGATITETVHWTPNACGVGVLERRFRVSGANDLYTECVQTIIIEEVNRYAVKFPGDEDREECGARPESDVMTRTLACDLLAISRDTVRFSASGEECFKMFVNYQIINWCEYDGHSIRPTEIARDIDADDDLAECTWLEAGRDEDFVRTYLPIEFASPEQQALGLLGAQHQYWIVKIFSARDDRRGGCGDLERKALPDKVLIRYTCPRADGKLAHTGYRIWRHLGGGQYEQHCKSDPLAYCTDQHKEEQCWTPGFFRYTQQVKVYDKEPPFIELLAPSLDFCAYGDPRTSCDGQVDIAFLISDLCSPFTTELRQARLLPDRDPARAIGMGEGRFVINRSGEVYRFFANLPVGEHRLTLQAADGCGNVEALSIDFSVRDCKSPAPVCKQGLAVALMPADEDGDGEIDGAMNTVWAADFLAAEAVDCSGPVSYSIGRLGEAPDREQVSLTFSCADPLFEAIPVRVYAWDAEGNHDFCEAFVVVEDLNERCEGLAGAGAIAGHIRTEDQQPLAGVRLTLNGRHARFTHSDVEGAFIFSQLDEGYDYTVAPEFNQHPLNGVSTLDLIMITKHILGVQLLNNPYRLIAADANNSKSITTLDLIVIRRLILGLADAFPNNASWRFVPRSYVFPNPANPWQEAFPEALHINDLFGLLEDGDFVAIKTGDVNVSARASGLAAAEPRGGGAPFELRLSEQRLRRGEIQRVVFHAGEAARARGYQFTLELDLEKVELLDLEAQAISREHFGLFPGDGAITASWHAIDGPGHEAGQPLFALSLRAQRDDVSLSELLYLSSRITPAEAYNWEDQIIGLTLRFDDERVAMPAFRLYQNHPNPWNGETRIGFELPEAASAALKVRDMTGRVLRVLRGDFEAGYQEFRLDAGALPLGVLYYTLETPRHSATRKMARMP